MKNILKITMLVLLTLGYGCDGDDDGGRFSSDPNSGWIQFQTETTDISLSFDDTVYGLPVVMQVPYNLTDLNIGYELVSVSGLDVNSFYNQNTLTVPANEGGTALVNGFPTIDFDLSAIADITEPMVFDVILTSTDRNSVTVGIDGADRIISNRVSICPANATNTSNFLGDYVLTVVTEEGPFGPQFEDGAVVTLVEGANGSLSRSFLIDYLPGVGAGDPITNIEFTFTSEGVAVAEEIGTGLSCDGGVSALVFGNDTENQAALPCGDDQIFLNMLDFKFIGDPDVAGDVNGTGGCGEQDVATTILLTKV
ncbi:hypothetical protein [Psychroserpens damuponensis]|uniref:hypothetical protein n=1 Tax=Psychroserpens damuponensis TaxID=943936 RepID=UPI00058C364F|nr:hypothetical protein [Psychroserpens damuponensis]